MRFIIILTAIAVALSGFGCSSANKNVKPSKSVTEAGKPADTTDKDDKPAVEADKPSKAVSDADKSSAEISEETDEPAKADQKDDKVENEDIEIKVARAAICTAIVDHEPQGSSEKFGKEIKKLYCFSLIKGVTDTLDIQHKWYHENKLIGTVTLAVKSNSWRTFSSKNLSEDWTGSCKVEIINSENENVLETLNFLIE